MPNYLGVTIQPANPVLSGLEAYGAVQDIGNRQTQNALARQKLQQEVATQNALKQFGQSGGKEVTPEMWQASPEMAMQAQKYITGLGADKRSALMDNIKLFDARKAMYISNPDSYAEDYKQVDGDFQKSLLPPDKFSALSPEQRKAELFAKEQIVSSLKGALTPYQAGRLGLEARKIDLMESPAEKRAGQKEIIDYREGKIRSRPTTEVDEDTGLPVGTQTGHVHYKKTKDSGKATDFDKMLDEERKNNPNLTRLQLHEKLKKDPANTEYNSARHEATTLVNAGRDANLSTDKKLPKIDELTEKIMQNRAKAKGGRKPGEQPTGSPPVSMLQEGHQTKFKNGQTWTLRNGQAERIQ